jgi:hypothetical protein
MPTRKVQRHNELGRLVRNQELTNIAETGTSTAFANDCEGVLQADVIRYL